MKNNPEIIEGGIYDDDRGRLTFINEFNFENVKRFYTISNKSTEIIRAWQGHKIENKYFYVSSGSFILCAVKIDDWDNPSIDLTVKKFVLSSKNSQILKIPAGYANGIKALEENSKLIVFSSNTLADSTNDDYRYDAEMWVNWSEI